MYYKTVFIFLFIIFLLATVLICVFQPKEHKHIIFENRNFKLELITGKLQSVQNNITVNIEPVEVPKFSEINVPELPKTSLKTKTNNIVKQNPSKNNVKKEVPKQNNNAKDNKVVTPQKSEKTVQNAPPLKSKDNEHKQKALEKSDVETAVPLQSAKQQNSQAPAINETPKTLTEKELEIIAWNKWRSDLQNKLMRDSKISAPIGTTFYFSFTVDKNGNISNLKTWANNPSYTPLAVKVIKPLLLSYQHTSILTFPANSKRIITNAEGSFTMAYSSRYSSPADYNDYERVIK